MKTYMNRILIGAILIAGAGLGFGIAQAEEGRSDNPAWTIQDQEAVEQYQDYAVGPSSPEWPTGGPMETGAIPGSDSEGTESVFAD